MNVVYLSLKDYKNKFNQLMGNRLYETPPWTGMQYQLEKMTAQGVSGPGTAFANELERMKHEYYNPKLPREITYHHINGTTIYRVK